MSEIWNKKSRLWKFTAVYLIVFELLFLIALVFFYNTIGRGLLTHLGDTEGLLEYSEWYSTVYQPGHPNDETIVTNMEMFQVWIHWGMFTLWVLLINRERKLRSFRAVWKKDLLETVLFAALYCGWIFLLQPHLTHYRLYCVMMPTQAIAVPLFLQLATHPDLPQKAEPERHSSPRPAGGYKF